MIKEVRETLKKKLKKKILFLDPLKLDRFQVASNKREIAEGH